MKIIDKLERWIRPMAIPNLTVLLISLQVFMYMLQIIRGPGTLEGAYLVWSQVLAGEIWRLMTFIMIPPLTHPIFLFFAWYIFYMMGTSLEVTWGTARYNLFIFLGVVLNIAAAALVPNYPAGNEFIAGTVFLAFATYNPNFELLVFFVLPVKIKWLALITWIGYGIAFLNGPNMARVLILASIGNYLLFFGRDLYDKVRYRKRRIVRKAEAAAAAKKPRHRCETCGITNLTHPDMDFRYCSKCKGQCGYCTEHIRNHEHVT